MAKIFTGNNSFAIQGSPDKRISQDKNGVFWSMGVIARSTTTGGLATFYYSTNSGSTWNPAIGSDLSLGQERALPSMYIDQDGYAHVSWIQYDKDPQIVRYARGTPNGGQELPGWTWKTLSISPASGRAALDSDIIAMRNGTGWVAFLSYSMGTAAGCQVARINISSKQALSVGATTIGPLVGLEAAQFGTIDFAHNGDGVTPLASPHLFLGTSSTKAAAGVRLNRATYSGGTWTWGTPELLASGNNDKTTSVGVWDGSRYMFAWSLAAASISMVEWDGVAAPVTRSPPALPGGSGVVAGISMAHDPVTHDIYLAFHDVTDGDVRWAKFTRATLSWSGWTNIVARAASTTDGQINLPRHTRRNTIPLMYSLISGTTFNIHSALLATLVRTPPTPTLQSPASGAKLNLALGGTFTWTYNPIAPGDIESAYTFRRVQGGVTDYWNATTQAFQSGTVDNPSDPARPGQVTFPAGKWTNGLTYTWAVRSLSSSGTASAYTGARTVLSAAAPVVAVTAPLNIIYEDSTPLVEWTYSSLDAQRDYEIRIVPEGPGISPTDPLGSVWSSGVVSSSVARSARIEQPLTNSTTYRAYVRATSVAGIVSDWMYSSFSIFVTPPSGPLVEAVNAIDYVSGVPRVRLDLTARSSFLTVDQDGSAVGWESDANATLLSVVEDPGTLLDGFSMTSVAAGAMAVRTVVGDPPAGVVGEPAPVRPLSFPVQAGKAYTFLASLRAATTTRAVRVHIRWYDDDDGTGTLISADVSGQVNATNGGYIQNSVSAVAPVGALLARVVIEVLGTTAAGEVFNVGQVSFHPGRVVAYQPGGFSTTATLRVERSDDGGATFQTVLSRVRPDLRQVAIAFDRLMPFGRDVRYRAYTEVDQGLGSTLSSSVSADATINLDAERWAIRDTDSADEGELYAYVIDHTSSDDESSSVHRPAGRYWPIVDTEGLQATVGTLTVFVYQKDVDYATQILFRTATFVVQSPSGRTFFARLLRRKYDMDQLRHRRFTIDYVEVDPTLGAQQ